MKKIVGEYMLRNDEKSQCFVVDIDDSSIRIDRYLSEKMQDISRSRIQKLIENAYNAIFKFHNISVYRRKIFYIAAKSLF